MDMMNRDINAPITEDNTYANELLVAEHISKGYGDKTIIEDISIRLGRRELVCLLGVSGSGKTTLFHVISGLNEPDEGRVLLDGQDITAQPGHVSYMLQKDLLLPHKKIIDNVSLPLVLRGMKKAEARSKAAALFDQFGLGGTEMDYPAQLSGGMRQRAALLRTYLGSQGVALLDEPFSALDALTKSDIHSWYLDVMEQIELSTLFITHDIDEALRLSDRIYILGGRPGRIMTELRPETARKNRDREYSLTAEYSALKKEIMGYLNR